MTDFLVDLSRFGFELEGEAINGNMKIRDFDKLIWDSEIVGGVDLKKILAIFPMDDMTMEGLIQADINTKGSYAAVQAENIINWKPKALWMSATSSIHRQMYHKEFRYQQPKRSSTLNE